VSRLDSFIRRLEAQRAVLDHACRLIASVEGPVLEIGLGNGRTYDHLRQHLPGRAIFAFDRALAAHPACVPDADHLILGDLRTTLPAAGSRLKGNAALAHCDFGSGDAVTTADLAAWLGPALMPLLKLGAIICSDQPLAASGLAQHAGPGRRRTPDAAPMAGLAERQGFVPLPLPPGVPAGRYFLYRNG
jgi:hypothetical protein